jgi:hypothetical protein
MRTRLHFWLHNPKGFIEILNQIFAVYPTDTINSLKGVVLQDSNYIAQTAVKHVYGNLRMFLLNELYSAHNEAIFQDKYDFLCKVKEHEWQVMFR